MPVISVRRQESLFGLFLLMVWVVCAEPANAQQAQASGSQTKAESASSVTQLAPATPQQTAPAFDAADLFNPPASSTSERAWSGPPQASEAPKTFWETVP